MRFPLCCINRIDLDEENKRTAGGGGINYSFIPLGDFFVARYPLACKK